MTRAILVLLVATVAMLGYVAHEVADLGVRINYVLEAEMQTLTNTWQSGGDAVTVTTTRQANETAAAFAARHKEAVDAAKEIYPPNE